MFKTYLFLSHSKIREKTTSNNAYTFAMASNYNRVPKSGVVAVTNGSVVELV